MLPLPDLITVDCLDCATDGHIETEYGFHVCETCYGAGVIEVCSGCLEVPDVVDGLEVCGCVIVAKAA